MRHHSLFEVSVFSSKPKSLILGSHPSRLNTFLSDAWINRGKKFSSAGQDSPRSQCRVRPVDLISPLLYPWLLSSTWIVVSVVIADTSLHILPEDKTETKMNQVITEGTVCRSHCSLVSYYYSPSTQSTCLNHMTLKEICLWNKCGKHSPWFPPWTQCSKMCVYIFFRLDFLPQFYLYRSPR